MKRLAATVALATAIAACGGKKNDGAKATPADAGDNTAMLEAMKDLAKHAGEQIGDIGRLPDAAPSAPAEQRVQCWMTSCQVKGPITDDALAIIKKRPDWYQTPIRMDRTATDADVRSLTRLPEMTKLSLVGAKDVTDATPLGALTNLEELNLSSAKGLHDLSPLASLTKLRVLKLQGVPFKDLTFVRKLTKLEEIEFFFNGDKIMNLDDFGSLPHLRKVHFFRSGFRDLTPLTGSPELRDLSLYACDKVEDLAPLTKLPKLQRLNLHSTAASSLDPIASLTDLRYLWLHGTSYPDYSPIAKLTRIEELGLSMSTFTDLSLIEKLPNLRVLHLWKTKIVDWKPLKNIVNLRKLDLRSTTFADLAMLTEMKALEKLELDDCVIKDLKPLAKLISLESLALRQVEIESIAPLADIPRLKYLFLRKGQVPDAQIEALKKKRPKLRISIY